MAAWGKTGSRLSVDYLRLYTAAHQKLSRRIKDRREILRGNAVDFSEGNVASAL